MSRDPLDRYYTPDALAIRLVDLLRIPAPTTILEPSVGGGAFVRACRERWGGFPVVNVVDADPNAPGLRGGGVDQWTCDDLINVTIDHPGYDLIVGNPPYASAEAHVRKCLGWLAPGGTCALLLPLAFLASRGRATLFAEWPPSVVWVLCERPSFTGNGRSDSRDYAWFIWGPGRFDARKYGTAPLLGWLRPEAK